VKYKLSPATATRKALAELLRRVEILASETLEGTDVLHAPLWHIAAR
jgi:hypothetical protein